MTALNISCLGQAGHCSCPVEPTAKAGKCHQLCFGLFVRLLLFFVVVWFFVISNKMIYGGIYAVGAIQENCEGIGGAISE